MDRNFVESFARLVERRADLLKAELLLWQQLGELLGEASNQPEKLIEGTRENPNVQPIANEREYLRAHGVAEHFGISRSTLAKWRMTGDGPEFVKIGRSVFYSRQTVEQFMVSKTKPHTSAYGFDHTRASARGRRSPRWWNII